MSELTPEQIKDLTDKAILPKYPLEQVQAVYDGGQTWEFHRLSDLLNLWKNPDNKLSGASARNVTLAASLLHGTNVLDIAAGSTNGGWLPYFARFCAISGANVVALDIEPQGGIDQDLFKWAEVDLIEEVKNNRLVNLPILRGIKFDIIYCADFVGGNPVPTIWEQLGKAKLRFDEFESRLKEQSMAMLNEGGIATFGHPSSGDFWKFWYYTRRNGEVVRIA